MACHSTTCSLKRSQDVGVTIRARFGRGTGFGPFTAEEWLIGDVFVVVTALLRQEADSTELLEQWADQCQPGESLVNSVNVVGLSLSKALSSGANMCCAHVFESARIGGSMSAMRVVSTLTCTRRWKGVTISAGYLMNLELGTLAWNAAPIIFV